MEKMVTTEFCELTVDELSMIDGGGWKQAGAAFLGSVLIGGAPIAGVATGIGASAVGTPVAGVAAGVGAYGTVSAAGAALLDYACK